MKNEQKPDNLNIDLLVVAVQLDGMGIWMQGDIEIRINGIKPYSESDIIDNEVLFKSLKSDGVFYIFSCNCGIPDCSGWVKGINVEHEKATIIWTNLNTKEKWVLDKKEIEKDLNRVQNEVLNFKEYFSEKKINYVGVGHNW